LRRGRVARRSRRTKMTTGRWSPRVTLTKQEEALMRRLGRVRKLLGFLRRHRSELFDDEFQDELLSMYRSTGAGKPAIPPAMMAMAMLVVSSQIQCSLESIFRSRPVITKSEFPGSS